MRYLSGVPYAPALRWQYGGLMLTPEMGNTPDLAGVTWAADNGCYTAGERFTAPRWLTFLRRWAGHGACAFAVAPDVPFDAAATWERSAPYLPQIRALGYRAALAVQNGITAIDWPAIDAVFIAGTKEFKTSRTAWEVCREAQRRGKWVHIARRNSWRAVQAAYDMGADSVDGTFLRFAPDHNWLRMQSWFERLCPHTQLAYWGTDRRFGKCCDCGRDIWRLVS